MTPARRPLTPYDTGARLEPRPWLPISSDHYGLVDFDDDEKTTQFTLVGKAYDNSPGYLLSVTSIGCAPDIELDGDRTAVLTKEMLAALTVLADFAQRGYDDFCEHAASTDDYADTDIADAEVCWQAARTALAILIGDHR